MNIAQRIFAYSEKQSDKYTRQELKQYLDLIQFDINAYFLSEEHMKAFQNSSDREKLKQIKQMIIENYSQDIRKEIALEMAKQNEEGQEKFLLKGVLQELDKLFNTVCYCLLGNDSAEALLVEESSNYNLFEKIMFSFKSEHSKELEAIKSSGLFTKEELKTITHTKKAVELEL